MVEVALGGERGADQRLADLAVDVRDRAADAEAAEAPAAVAKLGGLQRAGRSAGGDVGGRERAVLEREVDLNRRQAAAVEHLAGREPR